MQSSKKQLTDALFDAIMNELQQYPTGIKEYELLQNLRTHGFFIVSSDSYSSPYEVFQTHFLLFHALYLLRNQLFAKKQGVLNIEALNIQLLPYQEGDTVPTMQDKLSEYYLDLLNLDNTNEDDVNELIASFWNNLGKHEKRDDALATLGLEDPVDNHTIKNVYRRLAMEHHPDRGGDKDRLQVLNAAIRILLK